MKGGEDQGEEPPSQGSLLVQKGNDASGTATRGSKPTVLQLVESILLDSIGRQGRTAGTGAGGIDSGAAIVYVHKCATAESLAGSLVRSGFRAAAYSAKASPAARTSVLGRWRSRQLDVVVATVAFGMGIDRAGEVGERSEVRMIRGFNMLISVLLLALPYFRSHTYSSTLPCSESMLIQMSGWSCTSTCPSRSRASTRNPGEREGTGCRPRAYCCTAWRTGESAMMSAHCIPPPPAPM